MTQKQLLIVPLYDIEIKQIIFKMGSGKMPGLDGFSMDW